MANPGTDPVVIREEDVKAFIAPSPDHRLLRVMLSPRREPVAQGVSLGIVEVKPGPIPPAHSHTITQEAWYFLSGRGQIRVGDRIIDVEPGMVVVSPPQVEHQLIANRSEVLKALFILSPAGDEEKLLVE